MAQFVQTLQKQIVSGLEELEGPQGGRFFFDTWTRPEGGHGTSCVLQNGKVFEKAGVNISIIKSKAPVAMIKQMRARKLDFLDETKQYDFSVAGISMVLHPHNPMAPTCHLNYRYFELIDPLQPEKPVAWWFGGGSDLTPAYLFEEDCQHFHSVIKQACDKHDPSYYPRFKKWCDNYFLNTHRSETRGIGGIFFDDLEGKDPQKLFNFVKDCGESFLPQYIPILQKRIIMPYTQEQKDWQQLRRGRYVEFNLVHDRGTKFGLVTPGVRIESVLMSLPLTARWEYQHEPLPNSPEDKLLQVCKKPVNWA
jgi:coproporphyrinogen III oxidase